MSEGRPIYWGEMSKGRGVQIVRGRHVHWGEVSSNPCKHRCYDSDYRYGNFGHDANPGGGGGEIPNIISQ